MGGLSPGVLQQPTALTLMAREPYQPYLNAMHLIDIEPIYQDLVAQTSMHKSTSKLQTNTKFQIRTITGDATSRRTESLK